MSLRVRNKLSKPGNEEKKGRNKERERTRRGGQLGEVLDGLNEEKGNQKEDPVPKK